MGVQLPFSAPFHAPYPPWFSDATPRYFAGKVCAHHAANGLIARQCAVCQYNT